MSLKPFLKKIQYNYFLSGLVLLVTKPIIIFFRFTLGKLTSMAKVNGKTIKYAGEVIRFPRNVGINFQSAVYWHGTAAVEPHTVNLLKILFARADQFIDVGSNFGIYSLMARRMNKNISVLSFEPLENIANDYVYFQKYNGLPADDLYRLALSDSNGQVDLNMPDAFHVASEISSSSLEPDFSYNMKFNQVTKKITRTTLDDFWKSKSHLFSRPNVVIKIDVEGHEAKVLRGARQFLSEFHPWLVVEVDQHELRVSDLVHEIEVSGYLIYAITSYGYFHVPMSLLSSYRGERDFLLIPRSLEKLPSFFTEELLISYYSDHALNESKKNHRIS